MLSNSGHSGASVIALWFLLKNRYSNKTFAIPISASKSSDNSGKKKTLGFF